jgi:hypothetical protein
MVHPAVVNSGKGTPVCFGSFLYYNSIHAHGSPRRNPWLGIAQQTVRAVILLVSPLKE